MTLLNFLQKIDSLKDFELEMTDWEKNAFDKIKPHHTEATLTMTQKLILDELMRKYIIPYISKERENAC